MSSKIKVLPDHTINQIAAGEVIENPASAIKELIENSLDAGATEITVEIQGGGQQLLRITDNGCGMRPDDALLCLERHATSKIQAVEDISEVATMGFRGEALPSIASISKLLLITSTDGKDASMVVVEGGRILKAGPAARDKGTTLEVKQLFYNVPVRKRFQRNPKQDTAEILRVLRYFALAHPSLRIRLVSNQEKLLDFPPLDKSDLPSALRSRGEAVFDRDILDNAIELNETGEQWKLQGLLGGPSHTRPNRTGQILFINGRVVTVPAISYAIREGFSTRLDSKRYPIFILHLELAGENVDVNVHPQKREVRLRHELALREWIRSSVDRALQKGGVLTPSFNSLPEASFVAEAPSAPYRVSSERITPNLSWAEKASIALRDDVPQLSNWGAIREPDPIPPANFQGELTLDTPRQVRRTPKVIATLQSYFLIEAGDLQEYFTSQALKQAPGLMIVDQHLAHARILFEQMLAREAVQSEEEMEFQPLLMPITIDLPSSDARMLHRNRRMLRSMGLCIEDFGGTTVAVNALAPFIKSDQVKDLLAEIVTLLQAQPQGRGLENDRLKNLALAASRSALPSKKRLESVEAQSLLNQLIDCDSPYHCPCGRPTMTHLSQEHIAQLFQNRR